MAKRALEQFVEAVESLSEAAVSDQVVAQIAKMTDRNYHGQARLTIARDVLKDKKMAAAYEGAIALQDFFGSLTRELGDIRDVMEKTLKARLFDKLSKEDAEKVWGAL